MDPVKDIRHDHAELRSLGQTLAEPGVPVEPRERTRRFDDYRRQVARHLDIVEDVLLGGELGRSYGTDSIDELKTEHGEIRRALKHLDRRGKDDNEWSAEFRSFLDRFDQLCRRHERLMDRATARISPEVLDRRYARSRSHHHQGRSLARTLVATLAGTAALGGVAYAASRYLAPRLTRRSSDEEPGAVIIEETEVVVLAPADGDPADSRTPRVRDPADLAI